MKVTASGRKVFVLRYRTESNRQRKLTLGSFPEMTVVVAREAEGQDAVEHRGVDQMVLAQGLAGSEPMR